MECCYECLGKLFFWSILIWLVYKVIRAVYNSLLGPSLGLGVKWRPSENDWAIVTGSTDGIGLEYARQLASKGYNLLLISRNQEKLDTVKSSIQKDCPKCKKVDTLAFDFSETNYEPVEKKINSLDGRIDVLVNNVGISYPYPEYFTKLDSWKIIQDLININIVSVTKMTHLILPKMEAQRRGIIINISSYAGALPLPLYSVYSATKVYVDYFSRGLQVEYESKGIVVQSVLPAYVSTSMSKMKPSLMAPKPAKYVKSALSTVGIESRTYGYLPHKLIGGLAEAVNYWAPQQDFVASVSMKSLLGLRKRAYKKFNKKLD